MRGLVMLATSTGGWAFDTVRLPEKDLTRMRRHTLAVLGAASLAIACGLVAPTPAVGASVDTKRLVESRSPANAGQWMSYGRDYSEQRYSPLKQINVDNAGQLGLAWYADLTERGGSYETTPVVVDGRIYVTSPWSKV
ncbi:MAG: hypothetical protein ABI885_25650, partial [Gammaproteobacteria bacterium]